MLTLPEDIARALKRDLVGFVEGVASWAYQRGLSDGGERSFRQAVTAGIGTNEVGIARGKKCKLLPLSILSQEQRIELGCASDDDDLREINEDAVRSETL